MIRVFHHPGFAAPIGKHVMPMRKFALVADALRSDPKVEIFEPKPVTLTDLLRVHSDQYVRAVQTGQPRELAESQKFLWSAELYPSVLLTNGGVVSAAREALESGASAALASGFHHASQDRGEGFCTFNGLVVAAEFLRSAKLASKIAVLDLDLHYGNGTAKLARDRPWLFTLSIYGNDYWDNTAYRDVSEKKHEDGLNHQSVALPAGCNGKQLLKILEDNFGRILREGKPDLLLYQAGADPYFEDPYSPLQLTHEDLLERDRRVFRFSQEHAIPIAWVLAGGYTEDISKIVKVHVGTFEAWEDVYFKKS